MKLNTPNKPVRVLVCEDDPGILDVVNIALSSEGHEVILLDSFLDINETVSKTKPDIVLLDLSLHGGNGEEILKRLIQKTQRTAKIILMSANSKLPAIAAEHKVEYISKPFSLEELNEAIRQNS